MEVLLKALKDISEYIRYGFYDQDANEKTLKIYLIYTFSIVGFIFILPLGLKGYESSSNVLTFMLLTVAFMLVINLLYLKVTEDHLFAANVIFYTFFGLMLYLVYSGGVNNTGHLWIYCLPPIALFLHGLKKGLSELAVFLVVLIVMLYGVEGYTIEASYSDETKVRIVLSFLGIVCLNAFYEYSREKSIIKMKKLQKDLRFFLKQDELTGLYNRRGYTDNIYRIGSSKGVVLMCDIDHFKRINDNHGHDAGDFVIQEVAKCIRQTIRKDDVAVRWGGEEFLVFLSNTSINNAYFVSEKLRESVENLNIIYKHNIIKVTISIGIASMNDNTSLDDAIKNADNAMYLSKTSGRNKISKH